MRIPKAQVAQRRKERNLKKEQQLKNLQAIANALPEPVFKRNKLTGEVCGYGSTL